MANLQTDIDLFINRAQQKIGALGEEMRDLDSTSGVDVVWQISLIKELKAAIYLFQNNTIPENFAYKIIHYLSKKADLYVIPLAVFDDTVLVQNVLLPTGGFTTGPQGLQGDAATIATGTTTTIAYTLPAAVTNSGNTKAAIFNFAIPQGAPGTNGTNGDAGWSAVYSIANDGSRRVLEVVAWIGGTGTPPTPINVYLGTTGYVSDITLAVDIRGIPGMDGTAGVNGDNGWSPIYAIVNDGIRRVLQIIAWTGGSGVEPDTGNYIYSGGQTANIAEATDIRGPQGLKGDPFNINARGNLSDRNLYDNQGTGYTFLAEDTGDVYIKNSPISGDWSPPISFVGEKGWSPIFNTVEDGQRILIQTSDWVGGQGDKPDNQGYLYPGGFTMSPSDATDFRGARGEFFIDASGPLSDRPTYDSAFRPFAYYANDNGSVYLKNSNTTADWTIGFPFTGPRGQAGPVGSQGISGEGLEDWNSITHYSIANVVLHDLLLWKSNADNTDEEPGTGPSWDLQITNDDAYGFGYIGSLLGVTQNRFRQVVEDLKTDIEDTYYRLDGTFPLEGDMDADDFNIGNVGALGVRAEAGQSYFGQEALLNIEGDGDGVPFIHGMFQNQDEGGRAQFILSSEEYPANFMAAMTHGSSYSGNVYGTNKTEGTGDAGMAMLIAQGASGLGFLIGNVMDNPLYFMTDNLIRFYIAGDGGVGIFDKTLPFYHGKIGEDGAWRRRIDGNDYVLERYNLGTTTWEEKQRIS